MKLFLSITVTIILIACRNSETGTTVSDTPAVVTGAETKKDDKSTATAAEADLNGPVKAVIDMGPYIFRVHDIIQYHPSAMQTKLMKLDDAVKDFYIIDCSIENKTDTTIDVGINSLAAYFKLSDGSAFTNVLRGGAILGSHNTDNKPRYPQKQYDLLWSKKFPPKGKARADLYAVEIPEGATIAGVGFYQKSKTKNRYTDIGQ